MNWQIVIAIIGYLGQLMPLPLWTDKAAVRKWLQDSLLPLGEKLAALTATTWDDFSVATADALVANDDFYNRLYDLIFTDHKVGENGVAVLALARDAKISPSVIIALVSAIMKIIELLKNLKK